MRREKDFSQEWGKTGMTGRNEVRVAFVETVKGELLGGRGEALGWG